jgi:hypothetical protein
MKQREFNLFFSDYVIWLLNLLCLDEDRGWSRFRGPLKGKHCRDSFLWNRCEKRSAVPIGPWPADDFCPSLRNRIVEMLEVGHHRVERCNCRCSSVWNPNEKVRIKIRVHWQTSRSPKVHLSSTDGCGFNTLIDYELIFFFKSKGPKTLHWTSSRLTSKDRLEVMQVKHRRRTDDACANALGLGPVRYSTLLLYTCKKAYESGAKDSQ